jgi:hypothetical protein
MHQRRDPCFVFSADANQQILNEVAFDFSASHIRSIQMLLAPPYDELKACKRHLRTSSLKQYLIRLLDALRDNVLVSRASTDEF